MKELNAIGPFHKNEVHRDLNLHLTTHVKEPQQDVYDNQDALQHLLKESFQMNLYSTQSHGRRFYSVITCPILALIHL